VDLHEGAGRALAALGDPASLRASPTLESRDAKRCAAAAMRPLPYVAFATSAGSPDEAGAVSSCSGARSCSGTKSWSRIRAGTRPGAYRVGLRSGPVGAATRSKLTPSCRAWRQTTRQVRLAEPLRASQSVKRSGIASLSSTSMRPPVSEMSARTQPRSLSGATAIQAVYRIGRRRALRWSFMKLCRPPERSGPIFTIC
jgi:hypothetical protein